MANGERVSLPSEIVRSADDGVEDKTADWNLRTERVALPEWAKVTPFDEGTRVLQSLTRKSSYPACWSDLISPAARPKVHRSLL